MRETMAQAADTRCKLQETGMFLVIVQIYQQPSRKRQCFHSRRIQKLEQPVIEKLLWYLLWKRCNYSEEFRESDNVVRSADSPPVVKQVQTWASSAYNSVMFKTSQRLHISSLRFPAITVFSLSNRAAWPADTGEHCREEQWRWEMIAKRNTDSLSDENMNVLSGSSHHPAQLHSL